MIDKIFSVTHDIVNSENRIITENPHLDINHLDNYPEKYEKYFNDNFTLRNFFIKHYNAAVLKYLEKSPVPDKVIFGKNDWLFYGDYHLKTYRCSDHYTEEELIKIKNELLYRYNYLKQRNIKYYFVILPTKYSIYPEFVPDNITKLYDKTSTDQLIDTFGKDSPFPIIDTRSALLKAKKHNIRLFQKTDSHWNYAGAYFAYNMISEYLKKDFSEIKTLELSEFKVDSSWQNGGDLSKILSMTETIQENMIKLNPKYKTTVIKGEINNYNSEKSTIPQEFQNVFINSKYKKSTALIIHDSFTEYMIPFLSEDFHKSVFVLDRKGYGLNEDIIQNVNPDIFINIVLECHIKNILKNMSSIKNKN